MNTENSKTNEFRSDLADKLNLKNPKNIWL